MVQVCATIQEQKQLKVTENLNSAMDTAAAPPPPPSPPSPPSRHRRPRVREVSSRFMSPAVSTVQRRPRQQQQQPAESEPLSTADENRSLENSETPFPNGSQCKPNLGTTLRKQRAVKLFKENLGGSRVEHIPHPSKSCSGRIVNHFATPSTSRPDTPTVTVSSRYRLTQQQRSASVNATAAAKLLQASGMSQLKSNACSAQQETNSVSEDASFVCSDDDCGSSGTNCSIQSLPELCSSMPEGDMLPTVSTKSVAERIGNRGAVSSSSGDLKFHVSSPFSRSLNFQSSGSEHLLVHSIKGSEKQVTSLSKQYANPGKFGGLTLPPVPPCGKPATDARKGKKGSSHQEDVHSLRLLYNRYLQWRYANAKAESTMKAQQRETEKALYSHAMKISELRDSVNRKSIELGLLQRSKTLSTILEAQIPLLDEWSAVEEDYSVSMTEVIQALLNASVQLPIGGDVRVDVREVGETLNSALKMMETVVSHVQRFMQKAEETDIYISELARVVGGERAFIGECGVLLSKTYKSQVEEWSLRGQLIQQHSICHNNKNKEQEATANS